MVVALTGGDPTAAYMMGRLRQAGRLHHVIQVKWTEPVKRPQRRRPTTWKRVLRAVDRRLQDRWREGCVARLLSEMASELFGRHDFDVAADEAIEAHCINSERFAERLRAFAPDILLVNGAPILARSIHTVPRLGTLNVHFGVAPWYRGTFAQFWAAYHGDLEHLGATLHFVDDGVDSGPVVGYAFPERGPRDGEAVILARSAIGITEVVEKALDFIARGGSLPRHGTAAMDASATEGADDTVKSAYKKRDRRCWHDLTFLLRRHLRPPKHAPLPARQVLFF